MMIVLMKTQKCWEGKSKESKRKQMRRNAWACIVVGAEAQAIFVGMEGGLRVVGTVIYRGMGRCNCWHLSWVIAQRTGGGGFYNRRGSAASQPQSAVEKHSPQFELFTHERLPITQQDEVPALSSVIDEGWFWFLGSDLFCHIRFCSAWSAVFQTHSQF